MLWHKDEPVDVASESFVNVYVDRFNPETVEWSSYGAPKVSELGRLLAKLYKENKVGRYRHYCENWQDGYPKWFYILSGRLIQAVAWLPVFSLRAMGAL